MSSWMSNTAQRLAQGKRSVILNVTVERPGSELEAEMWPHLAPGPLNFTLCLLLWKILSVAEAKAPINSTLLNQHI